MKATLIKPLFYWSATARVLFAISLSVLVWAMVLGVTGLL